MSCTLLFFPKVNVLFMGEGKKSMNIIPLIREKKNMNISHRRSDGYVMGEGKNTKLVSCFDVY